MKELVKVSAPGGQARSTELARAAACHIVTALWGFVAARAVISGSVTPFGLSVLAGVPAAVTPAAAVGVFAGYFIPAVGGGAFRYIAALFAILTIKLLLGSYKKLVQSPLFLSLVCLAANALTAAVTLTGMPTDLLRLTAEVLLSAGGAFFVCRACRAVQRSAAGLSGEDMSALLISVSILLMGFDRLRPGGVSVGRVAGFLLILICAKYGGAVAGAVSGIAVSFSAVLTGSNALIAATCAFGGLMAGVFAGRGKPVQMGALLAAALTGAAIGQPDAESVIMMIEAISGGALFLLLPRSAGVILGKLFSCHPHVTAPVGAKKALTMRLNLAANALSDVSETVEQVSRELSKINAPDFSGVISGIERDACGGCKLRLHCWETRRNDTVNAVLEMTKSVKNGDCTPEGQAPDEFKGRCLRLSRVGGAVYRNYSGFASKTAAENRIDEVRSVVSDQFEGISSMLTDLARDLAHEDQFDSAAALTAAAALKSIDIRVDECSSHIDRFGRMTLELKLKKAGDLVLNKLRIMKLLSVACERDFDVPNISEVGGDIFMTLNEHAAYSVSVGVSQSCAAGSAMCGDAYRYFNDGKGHFIMILSDGMGTGGRAAVDSAMASGLMARLLKAGFGYDCSLRILNSSMLFKSTDESLATVDIASIDLHTGGTELYKAGAAPTLVRRSGNTGKAESTSLPAGILRNIGFDRAGIRLREGDILLLISDGAVSEGTDWIRTELENWRDGDAQDLAERICECAKRRRSDNHEDDITVMAAILERSVS